MTEFKFVREVAYNEYFTVTAEAEADALKLLQEADREPDTELVKYKTEQSDLEFSDFNRVTEHRPPVKTRLDFEEHEKMMREFPFGFKLVDLGQENGVVPEIADLIPKKEEALQYTETKSDAQVAKLLSPTSLILSYKHLGYPKTPGASNE